jgi:aryl-alcohol dehydrogenase-like predicted oxidoreductase
MVKNSRKAPHMLNSLKIALGSAQFGLNYGATNLSGKPDSAVLQNIMNLAKQHRVRLIDTAPAYGDAQARLAPFIDKNIQIITKFSTSEPFSPGEILSSLGTSLAQLKQDNAYGLLAHNAEDLLGDDADDIYAEMLEAKKIFNLSKIGVSFYNPDELFKTLDHFALDLIQIPISIFDQRFLSSGALAHAKSLGVEIHARSIFLQGLVLGPSHQTNFKCLAEIDSYRSLFFSLCAQNGITPLSAAIRFVSSLEEVDHLILGLSMPAELEQILTDYTTAALPFATNQLAIQDKKLILPTNWI